jgi:tetratricopeptide (TPR) repeat protein
LHRQGRLDEAATQYERALAIHEKALGADHVELAYDLTSLGECRLDQGRVDDAIPLLERALALRERSDGNAKLAERTREILARARRGANE